MRQHRIHLFLIACVLGSFSSLALAGTVSYRAGVSGYTGTQDVGITTQGAAVWNDFNGNTYKNGTYGVANGSYQARGLLRFNNLSLPAGATLTRATLTFTTVTWTTGFKILGYYLNSAWDATSPKLGWRNRATSSTWLTEGAGTTDVLPNTPFVLSDFKGSGKEQRSVDLDLSVVQGWIGTPASNKGIVLLNDSTNKFANILSAEDSVVGNRPMLTLTYLPAGQNQAMLTREDPEPAGSNCLYTGTAVRTGPDFNGDGVLADTEVQTTTYRCKAPFTQAGAYAGATATGNGGLVTFQGGANGYIGIQDAVITNQYAAAWNNYNGRAEQSGNMLVGTGTDGSSWNPLIRFDGLATVVPAGAIITKAELVLTTLNWSVNPTINGSYLKTNWNPAAANLGWLRRSDSETWTAAGGVGGGTDVLADQGFKFSLNANGRQTVTVGLAPALVQGWITTPSTNQGVLLTLGTAQQMASILGSEDQNPAYRPLLRLSYQIGTVTLTPLTRVDPEPRGAHCKWGGQATRHGLDFDGSGSLSNDEIQSSTYRCDAALVYVAPNGVDTWTWGTDPLDGTATKPFATIGFATRYIDDGGTVIVRPGTYHGMVRPEGHFTQGVRVKSEVPYAAKLRNSEMVMFIVGASGITLEGFDIAHEAVPGQETGPLLVHLDWYAHDIVLRNNIIHDSLNNDSLKINGGSYRVRIEGNLFYNAVAEQIRMDTVADVIIQDNVFFQDFEGAGRTPASPPGSYIEVADQDGGPTVKSHHVTIRRNVFLNWENSYGMNFVQLGGDAEPWYEASYVLIENNLMIGNNTTYQMRAPFGCKGAEYALFRNNTLVGDMHATAFLARLNMESGRIQNNYILFYNNVIANTAGTMSRLTTTPWNDTRAFALDHNLYWNHGRPIPEDAMELINPSDDPNGVVGDPGLAAQTGIVLPRWNEQTGKFLDGSGTIADVHHRLAWTYGRPNPQSAVVDATNPAFASTHDIFRHGRPAGLADLGAVEVETLAETVAADFDDGSANFSGAGWNPANYDLTGIVEPPPGSDHVTTRPSWYDAADNSAKPGQLFAPGNPWNVEASNAPLDANSARVIQSLASKGWGLGRMQVDFSLRVLQADAGTHWYNFTPTADFYHPDCDRVAMPVPLSGSLEGESGYQCTNNGDCHLLVIDSASHSLYEMWRAYIAGDGTFLGGCTAVWDTAKVYGPALRGDQCTSADAGGFPMSAMVFTADEVASGQINHAIRFILPNDRIRAGEYVYPATHGTPAATGNPYDVPYGGRLRLRADYPIQTLKPGAQVVARAMQRYGMILSDGGMVALTAADDRSTVHKWNENYGGDPLLGSHDLQPLQPSDFEVVDGGPPILLTLDCVRAP
jgi:serine/threonine-protein kinase